MHDKKKPFDTFNILAGNLLNQIYHFKVYFVFPTLRQFCQTFSHCIIWTLFSPVSTYRNLTILHLLLRVSFRRSQLLLTSASQNNAKCYDFYYGSTLTSGANFCFGFVFAE